MKFPAFITALVAAFGLLACGMVHADVATGAGADAGRSGTTSWSGALDKSQADGAGVDLTKELSPEARLLQEHLAEDDAPGKVPNGKAAAGKVTAAKAGSPAGAVAPGAAGAKKAAEPVDDWGSSFANAVRDVVKPIHNEIVNFSLVKSVREFDTQLKKPVVDEAPLPPVNVPMMAQPSGPVTSEEQARRDQQASAAAFAQLIDEAKPWAFGLMALVTLIYLIHLLWSFLHWKSARSGKRRRPSGKNSSTPT